MHTKPTARLNRFAGPPFFVNINLCNAFLYSSHQSQRQLKGRSKTRFIILERRRTKSVWGRKRLYWKRWWLWNTFSLLEGRWIFLQMRMNRVVSTSFVEPCLLQLSPSYTFNLLGPRSMQTHILWCTITNWLSVSKTQNTFVRCIKMDISLHLKLNIHFLYKLQRRTAVNSRVKFLLHHARCMIFKYLHLHS